MGRPFAQNRVVLSSSFVLLLGVIGSIFVGAVASASPMLALGAVSLPVLALTTYYFPVVGVSTWLFFIVFVPDWINVSGGLSALRPVQLLGLPVVAGLLLRRKGSGFQLNVTDFALGVALVLGVYYTYFAGSPSILLRILVSLLLFGYVIGRLSPRSVYRPFAVIMVGVALWGILELLTGWHAFEHIQGNSSSNWSEILSRGGLDRSEAGLGHPIAFGAACVIAIPFARTLKTYALPAQVILAAGALASLSRGPMIALVLTLGLSAVIIARGRGRLVAVSILALGVLVVYLVFGFLYSTTDANRLDSSGAARSIQASKTIGSIKPFGLASGATESASGVKVASDSAVIDSTPLSLALYFGWVVALLLLSPLLRTILAALGRQAGPASIALIGQIPVLLVTSLITQWQILVFFVAGLAISEISERKPSSLPFRRTPRTDTLPQSTLPSVHAPRPKPVS